MTEKTFLSPEEVAKRRGREVKEIKLDEDEVEIKKPIDDSIEKFYNRGGKVKIRFETLGRFDIDEVMYFEDYNTEHVDTLTLTSREDLLETIVAILDEIKNVDAKNSIGDCLLEEFLEIMIGIKQEFNTAIHTHRWVCECQMGKEREDIKVNETQINLRELKYQSIEQADEILREIQKPIIQSMSDENFEWYLKLKYKNEYTGNVSDYTREEEIQKIKIEEPIAQRIGNDIYRFNFIRVKDCINAKKLVDKKYAGKIKQIQNKVIHGIPNAELKALKEEELQEINKLKAKDILLYTRALTLVDFNGNSNLTPEEKVELYKKIKREYLFEFTDFLDKLKFGIQDEKEFHCSECGKTQKRLLQRKFDALEFIPVESTSSDRSKKSSGANIFIGL